jgi:cytochrome c biogenesis protein CcmG, thiol:disulfide interchange protein DsbE
VNARFRLGKLVPVAFFLVFAATIWLGLSRNPSLIPSVLIGKPVPQFELVAIPEIDLPGLSTHDLKNGKVTLVNIWASWCAPCREEQPLLLELAKRTDLQLVGINNKDESQNAKAFLVTMGNPYVAIGADPTGRATIDFGSYGVPESFLVDGNGIIRFKIIGGITPEMLKNKLPQEIARAAKPSN